MLANQKFLKKLMRGFKMNVYILLDRSGSMSTLWSESIGSINGYVSKLTKETKVHLAVFDSVSYDVVRECRVKDWKDVSSNEVTPRGTTPLYDSCGRIMALAEKENAKKTMLVVMTDGYENASKEYSQQQIKDRVKSWEDKKWEVVFLGANFDSVDAVSGSLGLSANKSVNYAAGNMMRGMEMLATSSMAYATSDTAINFTDDIKSSLSNKTSINTGKSL